MRIGLQDFNDLFDTLNATQIFFNGSVRLAPTISQADVSRYPVTSPAVVLQWKSKSGLYALAGIFDGVPGLPGHPEGIHVELENGDGAFTDLELGIANKKHYKLAVGGWNRTTSYTDLGGRPRHSNHGFYLVGSTRVFGNGSRPTLHAFVQLGRAGDDRNKLGGFVGAGLKLTHFIPGRPKDALGPSMARVLPSDLFERVKTGAGAETLYELTYQLQVTKKLALLPDLQYIDDPGLQGEFPNAWMAGFRINYKW